MVTPTSPAPSDTVAAWVAAVDAAYPEAHAEGWDATGLQVGDPDAAVSAVMVALDVTPEVVAEAAARGAELIIAHHPLLFRPLDRLTPATASGRTALAAATAGVAVLAAHTNVDVGVPGTTDPVADALGLVDRRPLVPPAAAGLSPTAKLTTFVPHDRTDAIVAALSDAGAGVIGAYDRCSFRVAGTGTFRPSAIADPAVGERHVVNEVAEDRVEVVVDRTAVPRVLEALRAAHPYEEVAVDVVALVDEGADAPRGLGVIGRLPAPRSLRAVCAALVRGLPAPHLRAVGDPDRLVEVVAACGGAGDGHIDAARRVGADVYVTGDLRHHPALDARTLGLALIDAGHHATEAPSMPAVTERIVGLARERGLDAAVLASRTDTCPWIRFGPGDLADDVEADSS